MEVRSIYKYARISQLKARDVAREIQGLPASKALDTLAFTPRKAADIIGKTLKSAIANAENNHDLDVTTLVVKEATVGKGPAFRRFKPRARGSASPIRKPTSHITVILTDEIEIPEPRKRSTGASKRKAKKQQTKAAAAPAEVVAPREVQAEEEVTEENIVIDAPSAVAPDVEVTEENIVVEVPEEEAAPAEEKPKRKAPKLAQPKAPKEDAE